MKKQFLFGMAAVAALCSCSNNEVMEAPESLQTPIAFGTYVGNSVNGRAAVTDIDALKNGTNAYENGSVQNISKGFGVFAYYTGTSTWATVGSSTTPNFMYNQEVQYSSNDNSSNSTAPIATPAWTYTPLKYWPNNNGDKISFYAYAPFTAVTNVATGKTSNEDQNITEFTKNSALGAPKVTYYVNPTAIKAQQDLVYARNQDLSKQTNVNNAAITTKQKVTFNFVHALARIGFNVETLIDEENSAKTGTTENNTTTGKDYEVDGSSKPLTIVKVTEVQLKGKFYKSGVLDLVNGTWGPITTPESESTFTLSYNAIPNAKDVTDVSGSSSHFVNDVAEKVTTDKQQLNAEDSYIMVIPQKFDTENETNGNLTIVVNYDVYTKDSNLKANGSTVVEEDVDGNGTAIWSKISNEITSSAFSIDFEQGKAYMFNLHLGLTSVKFDASVAGWGTESETVVNVPLNTATGAGA